MIPPIISEIFKISSIEMLEKTILYMGIIFSLGGGEVDEEEEVEEELEEDWASTSMM